MDPVNLSKYDDSVNSKNFYGFLLDIKTDLRKEKRKKNFQNFFIIWAHGIQILSQNGENESVKALFNYLFDELEKIYENSLDEIFLNTFKKSFNLLQKENFDKSSIKAKFMKFAEANKINEELINKTNLIKDFAEDSLVNDDLVYGYRFALQLNESDLLIQFIEKISKNSNEKAFLVSRTILELLAFRSLTTSINILNRYYDKNNIENNHPILNFTNALITILKNNKFTFNDFTNLLENYKAVLDLDKTFAKYLNAISEAIFSKTILKQEFNIMNLISALNN